MNEHSYEIGRIVTSKQGHDKGRAFVIVGVADDRYVHIADGESRKLEHPKKKQTKHLHTLPTVAQNIAQAIERKAPLLDSDVRKAIAQATAGITTVQACKEEIALVQE